MDILVAVSRVPDTTTKILVGSDGKFIDTNNVKFILNPYDEYALEEAIRLKEKNGGKVIAITVGPATAQDISRNALAVGADEAVHIKSGQNFDSFFVASQIAEYASKMKPDIIFMGKQSIDFDSLQVPSILSDILDLPLATIVTKLDYEGNMVKAEREIEGGKEVVSLQLPCIISAQKGLNEPRYPKLPDIMKAKKKPIEEIDAPNAENNIEIIGMELPSRSRLNKIVGDTDEDIKEIVRMLHEDAKIF
jgi:electron transfer flavoprotein beta subunit